MAATKRYLDFRFDVTDLSRTEREALAGEIVVQAETSDLHPGVSPAEVELVEVVEEDPIVVVLSGSDVLDVSPADARVEVRQYHRDYQGDGPFFEDDGRYEIAYSSSGALARHPVEAPLVDLVGNVVFDTPSDVDSPLTDAYQRGLRDGIAGRPAGDTVWFGDRYLPLHEPDDDAYLFVMYGANDGSGATVYAPACQDVGELERRLTRAFGQDGWTLDDHQEAVAPGGCTGYRDEGGRLAHDGDTCPVHEDAAALLRRYIDHDRQIVVGLTEKMPEETRREYLRIHDEALAAVAKLEKGAS